MVCSSLVYQITGTLHALALVVSFVGMIMQIHSVQSNQPFSIWLPLSLAIMMVLRIPNQICTSLKDSHGWMSVVGTLLAILGYSVLVIQTHNKARKAYQYS